MLIAENYSFYLNFSIYFIFPSNYGCIFRGYEEIFQNLSYSKNMLKKDFFSLKNDKTLNLMTIFLSFSHVCIYAEV